jgi:hypothetical protein
VEGVNYLRSSLVHDPLTPSVIGLCTIVALYRRDKPRIALMVGAILYLAYVVSIGGDFMDGRFLSSPFFVAILALGTSTWLSSSWARIGALTIAVALVLATRETPPATGRDYGKNEPRQLRINEFGIHDARAEFFQCDSLINARRMSPSRLDHPWTITARRAAAVALVDRSQRVQVIDAIGHAGYYAGPALHIIDHWALADPLLARLPAIFGAIGHYTRVIPEGYLDTLREGVNRIENRDLAAYYDKLALIARGSMWSAGRWQAIWDLNIGTSDHFLNEYAYIINRKATAHLRVRNPGEYSYVVCYLWNDWRTVSYVIDTDSQIGKTYELDWELTPSNATLLNAPGDQLTHFNELRRDGLFTFSMAFYPRRDSKRWAIYELRYGYLRRGDKLVILRDPLAVRSERFPGDWQEVSVDDVLRVTGWH